MTERIITEPDIKLEKLHESQSFFEMLGEYILAGFKVAMIILAMLIGFIALISAINALFSSVFGMSFQQILGYVFYPLAWLVGIPLSDGAVTSDAQFFAAQSSPQIHSLPA